MSDILYKPYKLYKLYKLVGLVAAMLVAMPAFSQRINFGTFATSNIVITPGSTGELNFNQKQTVILAGYNVSINLSDNMAAILAIEANSAFDITIEITADPNLELVSGPTTYQIPYTLSFAYCNTGAATESQARLQAVQVPIGFTGVTIPVLRRVTAAPAPPPTPDHAGYVAPKSTVYLFIYGSIAVPVNAGVGEYTGNINVNVSYTANTP